MAISLFRQFLQ